MISYRNMNGNCSYPCCVPALLSERRLSVGHLRLRMDKPSGIDGSWKTEKKLVREREREREVRGGDR